MTLNLSPAPDKNITLNYLLGGALYRHWLPLATSGSDFEALSGRVTVLAGATNDGDHPGDDRRRQRA